MFPPKRRLRRQKGQAMSQLSQRPRETVVGAVVARVREGVSSNHRGGAVGGVGRVINEIDFAKQSLLMVLKFAHHFNEPTTVVWLATWVYNDVVLKSEVQKVSLPRPMSWHSSESAYFCQETRSDSIDNEIISKETLRQNFLEVDRLGAWGRKMPKVHLLDYAAGNIRSLVNAIEKLGWEVEWIQSPSEVANADVSCWACSPKSNSEC